MTPSSHHTGDVTAALHHTVRVDVTRIVAKQIARSPEKTARRLIPHETRLTRTALKGTLTHTNRVSALSLPNSLFSNDMLLCLKRQNDVTELKTVRRNVS